MVLFHFICYLWLLWLVWQCGPKKSSPVWVLKYVWQNASEESYTVQDWRFKVDQLGINIMCITFGHNHWPWSLSKTYSDLLKMYFVTKGFNINSFFKFYFLDLFVALSEMDIRFLQQPLISPLLCSREWLGLKEILLSMPVFLLLGSAWIHPVHR